MRGRIVKLDPAIEMRAPFRDVAREDQRTAQEAMPNHPQSRCGPPFGECGKLRPELTNGSPVECKTIRIQKLYTTENNSNGSSGGSPRASAFSMSKCARSAAALVSG